MAEYRNERTKVPNAVRFVQRLKEERKMEPWLKNFCDSVGVFACCTDVTGKPFTSLCGKADEVARIEKAIDQEQLENMVRRVSGSTLEDQAIEETAYSNFRMAVVSVKVKGIAVLNWLIFGVLSDVSSEEGELLQGFTNTITEKVFTGVLDLLAGISEELVRLGVIARDAQIDSEKSRQIQRKTSILLKRMETLTEIIQLLESDDPIEEIMSKFLQKTGKYLGISTASICRVKKSSETMMFLAHWTADDMEWTHDEEEISCPFFVGMGKPLILSESSKLSEEEQEGFDRYGIRALVAIPIETEGNMPMYAVFTDNQEGREWEAEEVKFLSDAVRILHSIITKRIQKNSLASSYASLEKVMDNVGSAVYVKDIASGQCLFANSNMMTSFEKEIKDGRIHQVLEKGDLEKGRSEVYIESRDKWYELHSTKIKWVDGRDVILYSFYDETEKKIYQKKIEQQANTDFLTGLYNRMCCERDLADYIEDAKISGKSGAVLYLDLDDFKHINDGLGHQYGDVLLKAIAHSFQKVEGLENSCYRMGGDEFVLILPPRESEKLEQVIDSIKKIFMQPWFLKDSDYYCTMSMGIVSFPEDGEIVHELIKKADIAMYEAKKNGKNGITVYSKEIGSASGRRLNMEQYMRAATAKGYQEFEVYFQPIIDIRKEKPSCTGAEALIRWNSSELGFISPAEFIPLAEYLGLINPIGNHILREACAYCKKWNDNGYPNYKVNVNLSVVQLLQNDIYDIVKKAIDDTGINTENLTLEVTESLAINDIERMKGILGKIKTLGVRIALDDFGTGYSSLNHVKELPLDVIKVDQTFTRNIERDAYSKAFMRIIAELAQALDVNLCVEGVENKEQYEIVSAMNVGLIQGYYFDKPMSKSEFEAKYVCKGKEDRRGDLR